MYAYLIEYDPDNGPPRYFTTTVDTFEQAAQDAYDWIFHQGWKFAGNIRIGLIGRAV